MEQKFQGPFALNQKHLTKKPPRPNNFIAQNSTTELKQACTQSQIEMGSDKFTTKTSGFHPKIIDLIEHFKAQA